MNKNSLPLPVDPVTLAGGCRCRKCRYTGRCLIQERMREAMQRTDKRTDPFCAFGEPESPAWSAHFQQRFSATT